MEQANTNGNFTPNEAVAEALQTGKKLIVHHTLPFVSTVINLHTEDIFK